MYYNHVYLIDPNNPDEPYIVFGFESLELALRNAREYAWIAPVAYVDVIAPDGARLASYTISGHELVDMI